MTFNINWTKKGVYVKFRGLVTAQDLIDANNYIISNANFDVISYQIFDFLNIEGFKITSYDINVIGVMDKAQAEFKQEMKVAIVTQDEYVKQITLEYNQIMTESNWITQIFGNYESAKDWAISA